MQSYCGDQIALVYITIVRVLGTLVFQYCRLYIGQMLGVLFLVDILSQFPYQAKWFRRATAQRKPESWSWHRFCGARCKVGGAFGGAESWSRGRQRATWIWLGTFRLPCRWSQHPNKPLLWSLVVFFCWCEFSQFQKKTGFNLVALKDDTDGPNPAKQSRCWILEYSCPYHNRNYHHWFGDVWSIRIYASDVRCSARCRS